MGDYCKGCAARPGDGFVGGHRSGCRQTSEFVCGVKLHDGGGAICARPAKECDDHDVMRAMTSLWLGCGFIGPSGVGDTLCAMAERARVRLEELVEIVNKTSRSANDKQTSLELQEAKHRKERDAWQGNYITLLAAIGVADDVARGHDAVEACKSVVEASNERCDAMLRAEAEVRRLEAEIVEWRAAWDSNWQGNENTPTRLKEWCDEVRKQREEATSTISTLEEDSFHARHNAKVLCDAYDEQIAKLDREHADTAAARDEALDKSGRNHDEIVALRKLLEETENQRRDEVQAWQAAASADQLVDIQSPEALVVRLRDLVATRAQLQGKIGKIVEVMCSAGRGKMAVEDDVADLVQDHAELAAEMAHGADPSAVMESVARLGDAAAESLPPAELRDALLDAVAQATADRVFEWLTGEKAE